MARGVRDLEKQKYWLLVMQDWQQSGLTQQEFCRQRGVRADQFSYWRRELKRRKLFDEQESSTKRERRIEVPKLEFVPLKVTPVAVSAEKDKDSRLEIVTPGGYIVRIP